MTTLPWYWIADEQRCGPVDTRTLRDMLAREELLWTTSVWCPGMDEWQPAVEVEQLAPSADLPDRPARECYVDRSKGMVSAGSTGPASKSTPTPALARTLAPLWLRLLAKTLDLFIIMFGVQLLLLIASPLMPAEGSDAALRVINAIVCCVYVLYFAAAEGVGRRASLGKQVCGIEVIAMTGESLSLRSAAIRAAVQLFTLGWLLVFAGPLKQSLHDRAARSIVVVRESNASS